VIRAALQLKREQPLVHIKRLFLYAAMPIALNESWIPDELVPNIVEEGLMGNHLSVTLIKRYKLSPVRIQNTIEAVNLNAQEIKTLNVNFETPIISVTSVSSLPYDVPLEYSRTLWRGDRVKFSFAIPASPEANLA